MNVINRAPYVARSRIAALLTLLDPITLGTCRQYMNELLILMCEKKRSGQQFYLLSLYAY